MKITVKVFKSENLVLSKVFDQGSFRVGKSEFCDLVLNEDHVSRSALEVRVTESAAYFTNMGPGGKLKVDGKKQETGELKDGSIIELGGFKLAFIFGEEVVEPDRVQQAVISNNPEQNAAPAVDNSPLAEDNGGNNDIFNDQFIGNINGNNPQEAEEPQSPASEENQRDEGIAGENVLDFPDSNEPLAQPVATVVSSGNLALKEKTETFGKPLVAKVIITEGPRQGEEIPLQSFELSFGRSSKADVVINDHKLSRVHAKIIRFGNGYRIIDLNSHNGTRVNGVRILEHPLSSYDVIEFGQTKIKFLIHDIVLNETGQSGTLVPVQVAGREITKSLYLNEAERQEISLLRKDSGGPPNLPDQQEEEFFAEPEPVTQKRSPLKIFLVVFLAVGIGLLVVSQSNTPAPEPKLEPKVEAPKALNEPKDKSGILPKIPKDFYDLSDEMQRRIEGSYNSASSVSQRIDVSKEELEKAKEDLARIHQSLPYYKNSRELLEQLDKRYRDKLAQMAAERAKDEETQDLKIYLEDGIEYLKQGEFDRALESFRLALNLDPRNPVAIKGLKAAEAKVRDLESVPPERDPEEDKIKQVKELYSKAVEALNNRAYEEAIQLAESIRKIYIKSDQTYLNEAKQIIDRAKIAQKEEFEPFLIQAKEKFSEGDYNAARDLCEEMLKKDSAYEDAKELLAKSKKQLNRLAKEAYTHGYILESIGQLEQAKQYWNRAKNYVRQGDEYFEKVNKKLDQYQ